MLYGQTPGWLEKIERRMPGLGIPNLAAYLVGAQALGFLLVLFEPRAWDLLVLDPRMVLKGEVWRLVTFLALPLSTSWLWMVFVLYFIYFIVNGIEEEWGEFKTTFYVLVSLALTVGFSFVFMAPITNIAHFQSTLFLAAATIAPEYRILLFLVLPVKMKWLAWITLAYILWALAAGPWLDRLYLLTIYSNYMLFFGPYFIARLKQIHRREKFRRQTRSDHRQD